MKRIAVIGLGVIGGSIVLALKNNAAPYSITGIDTSRRRLRLLRKSLDETSSSWKAASTADLVVLCMHYEKIMEYLAQAPRAELLLDVCSGKQKIMTFAERKKIRLVGGHPLAGNEYSREQGWQQDLFKGTPFFISPASSVKRSDLANVKAFITSLGAKPIPIDPGKHDRYVAASSHFPAFLSVLLRETNKPVPAIFQGPGFASMTRLSRTPHELLDTFLLSNGSNIKKSAVRFRNRIDRWLTTIKKN